MNGNATLQTGKWWEGNPLDHGFTEGMTKGGRAGDKKPLRQAPASAKVSSGAWNKAMTGFAGMRLFLVLLPSVVLGAAAPLHAGEEAKRMQVAICPRLVPGPDGGDEETFVRRVEELFISRTDEWKQVSENISHFKFYSTPVQWLAKRKPEILRRAVGSIAAMDKGIALEVGIRHGHAHMGKSILDPITQAGGRVDFIITDNVFIKSQFRKDKKDQYGWTYDQTVEKYAEYVAGIKKNHPRLKVGILEAGFRFHWEDPTRFPAEVLAKDCGDLKALLIDVIEACEARGTRIDIFQPEYSYERIENTRNGWEKLKAMEAFCDEQGIEFHFLFNDHAGGRTSDRLFHENVMQCLRSVKAHGLTPELGTVQSWYEHPVKDLPEDQPHTFMFLARELIRENGTTSDRATPDPRGGSLRELRKQR